jgi:hypothetical protein
MINKNKDKEMITNQEKIDNQNKKLRLEVKKLAQSRIWPELRLSRSWPAFKDGFFKGIGIGFSILLIFTRFNFEGFFDLLKGGGGGVGLIIIIIVTISSIIISLFKAMETTSGEEGWNSWLTQSTLKNEMLSRVKDLLEAIPEEKKDQTNNKNETITSSTGTELEPDIKNKKTCIHCDHFIKTGKIDKHKGVCQKTNETTYANWGC